MPDRWGTLIADGSTVLAAVSGGADSVCLALHLKELAPRRNWTVRVAHCEHRLRGEGAARDAEFVRAFAEREGLPFHHLHVLKTDFSDGESVEAALREERYARLRDLARETGAAAIALGHSATDAAETFLMMALRGSGPRGLGSMRDVARIPGTDALIVRPLLDMTREEIRASLRERNVAWIEDPTNESDRYRRNRVRRDVLPALEAVEPAAVRTIARSARHCAEEADALGQHVGRICPRAILARTDDAVLFDVEALREVEDAHAAELVREIAVELSAVDGMALPPGHAAVGDLLTRLRNDVGDETRMRLSPGVGAIATNVVLLLHSMRADGIGALAETLSQIRWAVCAPADFPEGPIVELGARLDLGAAGTLAARQLDSNCPISPAKLGGARAAVDPSATEGLVRLRRVRADDWLATRAGRKSAFEALRERGIPASVRDRVLAVADDAGVLWIPGVRRADRAFVSPDGCGPAILLEWARSA